MQQFEAEPEQPEIEPTPPAKLNYMPHAPAIGAEGHRNTKIWGYTAERDLRGRLGPHRQDNARRRGSSSAAPPRSLT